MSPEFLLCLKILTTMQDQLEARWPVEREYGELRLLGEKYPIEYEYRGVTTAVPHSIRRQADKCMQILDEEEKK